MDLISVSPSEERLFPSGAVRTLLFDVEPVKGPSVVVFVDFEALGDHFSSGKLEVWFDSDALVGGEFKCELQDEERLEVPSPDHILQIFRPRLHHLFRVNENASNTLDSIVSLSCRSHELFEQISGKNLPAQKIGVLASRWKDSVLNPAPNRGGEPKSPTRAAFVY